jgi:predicted nucleotidyltransferase
MARADADTDTDGSIRAEIQRVLSAHPVSFAMLFGSATSKSIAAADDIDLAVEFETHRPSDDGYSDVYLQLVGDLEAALPIEVDVVDVHTMDESFATVVFDAGEVLVGDDRRSELAESVTGARPSAERARNRVSAAADRLTEPDG